MFREIRTSERISEEDEKRLEEERRKNQGYLKIKPKTDITFEECEAFWNSVFHGEEP